MTIVQLLPDDFEETENLQVLELQNNLITSLNSSLLPLKRLRSLNLTHNMLNEFSWHEVRTLTELRHLDLSSNKIRHLSGMTPVSHKSFAKRFVHARICTLLI